MSVIFTLVPYLYTCAALLCSDTVTLVKHARHIWQLLPFLPLLHLGRGGVRGERGYVVIVTLMVITAMYALNYNRLHKTRIP